MVRTGGRLTDAYGGGKWTRTVGDFYANTQISFFGFYGLSDKAHPNLEVDRHERSIRGSWKISEYDEWVKLVEAAADMLMYYLPHIGSLEDLVKLMQAHDAGETNFNHFTLPETNPALREFCVARDLKKLTASE
ncbi:hypothetical protein [Conchiformibius steedae]|uniref:Uncharacterized protein n=1 Tax=Conchiformibius steedae TaxID=153493 RepID=A0A3P1ZZR7_9NEIS|nr:hypothetical protein [Conchiformibius steedae]RRD88632.1 hypothetical protein EII21_11165 [Conchiformibius steedae]